MLELSVIVELILKGDQASIVGGAIDFVKELEQHLQSLEAKKRMRRSEGFTSNVDHNNNNPLSSSSPSSSAMAMPSNGMFMSLSQCKIGSLEEGNTCGDDGVTAQNKSEAADIDVTVIQTHVNLKVKCQKRPGQLVRALVALEDFRLTVLHLNITSSEDKVLYSFNLKVLYQFFNHHLFPIFCLLSLSFSGQTILTWNSSNPYS